MDLCFGIDIFSKCINKNSPDENFDNAMLVLR